MATKTTNPAKHGDAVLEPKATVGNAALDEPSSSPSPEVGMVEQDLREAIADTLSAVFRDSFFYAPNSISTFVIDKVAVPDLVRECTDAILQLPAISLASRDLKPAASGGLESEHPEARCGDCGGPHPVWFAPSPLWNLVMGGPEAKGDPGGIICPVCFILRAEAAGERPTAWVVTPERLKPAASAVLAEPTPEMLKAGRDVLYQRRYQRLAEIVHGKREAASPGPDEMAQDARACFAAMLAIAPSTPPQVEREGSRDDLEALDLDAMEKVAREASQSSWSWAEDHEPIHMRRLAPGVLVLDNSSGCGGPWGDSLDKANAAHIALFDPPTVLRLIATNREMAKERDEAIRRRDFTTQWYAERLEPLKDLCKRHDCWPEAAAIIANGSGTRRSEEGYVYDPPTYAQQLNIAKHKAAAAEATNRELLDRLKALEDACDALAADRSMQTYESILADGGADALLALDDARREARTAISNTLSKSEGSRDE